GPCACGEPILSRANAATGRRVLSAIAEVVADTDHYPFAALGIPAIVLGTVHELDTHRPTDTADRIDAEALARRAAYARAVVLDLPNRAERPRFVRTAAHDPGFLVVAVSGQELRDLGLEADAGALKVSAVIPGLAADRAGLVPGEFIIGVDGAPLPGAVGTDAV